MLIGSIRTLVSRVLKSSTALALGLAMTSGHAKADCPDQIRYESGAVLRSGDTWYYPNGAEALASDDAFYGNRRPLASDESLFYGSGAVLSDGRRIFYGTGAVLFDGATWFYSNGSPVNDGDTIFYRDGVVARQGGRLFNHRGAEVSGARSFQIASTKRLGKVTLTFDGRSTDVYNERIGIDIDDSAKAQIFFGMNGSSVVPTFTFEGAGRRPYIVLRYPGTRNWICLTQ